MRTVKAFVVVTINNEQSYPDSVQVSDGLSEREAKELLKSLADKSASMVLPVDVAIDENQLLGQMIDAYQRKIDQFQQTTNNEQRKIES